MCGHSPEHTLSARKVYTGLLSNTRGSWELGHKIEWSSEARWHCPVSQGFKEGEPF